MEYVAWALAGVLFYSWNVLISKDKLSPVLHIPFGLFCAAIGPLCFFPLAAVWTENKFETGIPWYRQGRQMPAARILAKEAAREIKERLLEQGSYTLHYLITFNDGKRISGEQVFPPSVRMCSAPEYYFSNAPATFNQSKRFFLKSLEKSGYWDSDTYYPWHEIKAVEFVA